MARIDARRVWWWALVLVRAPALAADGGSSNGTPLNIPPSQFWDGKDGPWSTFRIEVGSPAQQVRVLPAQDQSSTWLVISEACKANDDDCISSRGEIYRRDNSTTWSEYGKYNANPVLEERVGLNAPAVYGWDTITLGWSGDSMPTLKNQSIAGITTQDFWVGSLSLNPRPVNFTDYNSPIPSLMDNLRNKTENPIPSLSWSYTAGAYNLSPKILGSLVLGGFDSTRFQPNSVTFPFGNDISFDFQVAIQSITTSSSTLLDTGIVAYVSTLVPDIWLPTSVCKKFEDAFGLVWDNQTQLYLLNSTLHQTLLEKNPSVAFRVGPEVSGAAVPINMPYWNFYQTAKFNYSNPSSDKLYFPLKRAANDSQYILGRTFLQSAHISADYERRVFNLSQALYPSSGTSENIVAVLPPSKATTPGDGSPGSGNGGTNGNEDSSKSSSSLGTGAIVGIAVGLAVAAAVLLAMAFIWYRRRKNSTPKKHELADTDIMNDATHEVSGDDLKIEMGEGLTHELTGDMDPHVELGAYDSQKPAEAEGSSQYVYEMPGNVGDPVELSGETAQSKIPAAYFAPPPPLLTQTPSVSEFGDANSAITPLSEHRFHHHR